MLILYCSAMAVQRNFLWDDYWIWIHLTTWLSPARTGVVCMCVSAERPPYPLEPHHVLGLERGEMLPQGHAVAQPAHSQGLQGGGERRTAEAPPWIPERDAWPHCVCTHRRSGQETLRQTQTTTVTSTSPLGADPDDSTHHRNSLNVSQLDLEQLEDQSAEPSPEVTAQWLPSRLVPKPDSCS